jgi:hypothetical protein
MIIDVERLSIPQHASGGGDSLLVGDGGVAAGKTSDTEAHIGSLTEAALLRGS